MGDEIGNGGKLQKELFCLVKKIGGQHWSFCLDRSGLIKKIGGHICHFVLLGFIWIELILLKLKTEN